MSGDYERDPGLPRGVMSERHGPRFTARLLFGLVLVSLGALWTLENLGVPEASEVLRWWPSLLVAYGCSCSRADGCWRASWGSCR